MGSHETCRRVHLVVFLVSCTMLMGCCLFADRPGYTPKTQIRLLVDSEVEWPVVEFTPADPKQNKIGELWFFELTGATARPLWGFGKYAPWGKVVDPIAVPKIRYGQVPDGFLLCYPIRLGPTGVEVRSHDPEPLTEGMRIVVLQEDIRGFETTRVEGGFLKYNPEAQLFRVKKDSGSGRVFVVEEPVPLEASEGTDSFPVHR